MKTVAHLSCLCVLLAGLYFDGGAAVTASQAKSDNTGPVLPVAHPEEYVNTLGGTQSRYDLSHGNVLPLVAQPWAMNTWSPVTNDYIGTEQSSWWFHPDDARFFGIRCTHQPSPWISDYGWFTVMPSFTDPNHADPGQCSAYSSRDSTFKPYLFNASLLSYANDAGPFQVEFTSSNRTGVMRVSFPPRVSGELNRGYNQTRRIMVKLPLANHTLDVESDPDLGGTWTFVGITQANSGGVPKMNITKKGLITYFHTHVLVSVSGGADGSQVLVPSRYGVKSEVGFTWAYMDFDAGMPIKDNQITLRMTSSFISRDQARTTLKQEVGNKTFDDVFKSAKETWRQHLSHARVTSLGQGYSPQQSTDLLTIFYSCLYRASLMPRHIHEIDADGKPVHYSPFHKKGGVFDGVITTDSGFWDAYRTVYPMLSIFYPDQLRSLMAGWLNAYNEGGWLPKWASPGYRGSMVGTMGDASLADAIVKGILRDDEAELAYEAARKDAFEVPPSSSSLDGIGVGRVGLQPYLQHGYIPAGVNGTDGIVSETVSRTLNYALSDFAIAQAAKVLNRTTDHDTLLTRASRAYRALFDLNTGFFRPKDARDMFLEPFDQYAWGGEYTEGGPWQYRFYVPFNASGLRELYAVSQRDHKTPYNLCQALSTAQMGPSLFHLGGYGSQIHEMTEMAMLCWGQYEHDNQPVHHELYMFIAGDDNGISGNCANEGRSWIRKALIDLHRPGADMYCGDEDNGEFSAWYLLSASGLYALAPGTPDYVLGSPLFERLEIDLPEGKTLTVSAPNNGPGKTAVESISWNGQPLNASSVAYDAIMSGGVLEFSLK